MVKASKLINWVIAQLGFGLCIRNCWAGLHNTTTHENSETVRCHNG